MNGMGYRMNIGCSGSPKFKSEWHASATFRLLRQFLSLPATHTAKYFQNKLKKNLFSNTPLYTDFGKTNLNFLMFIIGPYSHKRDCLQSQRFPKPRAFLRVMGCVFYFVVVHTTKLSPTYQTIIFFIRQENRQILGQTKIETERYTYRNKDIESVTERDKDSTQSIFMEVYMDG